LKTIPLAPQRSDEDQFRDIAVAIESTGYAIVSAALPELLVDALLLHCKSLHAEKFHQAGTGRAFVHQINPQVRGDKIRWFDGTHPATRAYLDWVVSRGH
jgi:hypothetical protein